MDIHSILDGCRGFQWDKGNSLKSWLKHSVTGEEAEQGFFNEPLLFHDNKHSEYEDRFLSFGKTDEGRYLVVAFTVRERHIRIISARNMNKKEREDYEKF